MTDVFDEVAAVADAVLFEGYLLYPYRASAQKNRLRWQFGVLTPAVDASEPSRNRTECLLEPGRDGGRRLERLPDSGGQVGAARLGEGAFDQRLRIVVCARRAADENHARLDVAAAFGARIVEPELRDAVCNALRQRLHLAGMLTDDRRNQRCLVVARADVAGAAIRSLTEGTSFS